MNVDIWQRVRALFDLVVDVPGSARAELLEALLVQEMAGESAADREIVRTEVLLMLVADQADAMKTNMDALAPELLTRLSEDDHHSQNQALVGLRVGAFCLLRELGRGGMGTVWLAQRADGEFEQQVAIKLIQPGWHAAETLARFRAERQILAGLKHPNIAHLIDGGMNADGRPWLALEYVDGLDLRQYCDQHDLNISQRLQLFLTVCEAVSYAHARLIVHRDLKPSNLLITHDGNVKLLDFGIAKLIAADSVQVSQSRSFTPEYAAPEQVRGELITTSVDVYGLGLLLYELLSGHRALAVANSTPAAYEQAILHSLPDAPSQAVLNQAEIATASRPVRNITARSLALTLRGDLDAIVLKSLRKEPDQRYASVADMADDLRRYLAHEPVLARRGRLRYRVGRFLQRHALASVLAAVASASLVLGFAVALWQAQSAQQQRDLAQIEREQAHQEARRANATAEFMARVFEKANPSQSDGRPVLARDLLVEGEQRLYDSADFDPSTRASLGLAMARAYAGLGDHDAYLRLTEKAREAARASGVFKLQIEATHQYSAALVRKDRNLEALVIFQQQMGLLERSDANTPLRARNLRAIAAVMVNLNRSAEGLEHIERAYQLLLRRTEPLDSELLSCVETYLWLLRANQRQAEALAITTPLYLALQTGPSPSYDIRARVLAIHGKALLYANRAQDAERVLRESLALAETVHGPNGYGAIDAKGKLADAIWESGRLAEATKLSVEAARTQRKHFGAENRQSVLYSRVAADRLLATGNPQDALELLLAAVPYYEKNNQSASTGAAWTRLSLAEAHCALGQFALARPIIKLLEAHADSFDEKQKARLQKLRAQLAKAP